MNNNLSLVLPCKTRRVMRKMAVVRLGADMENRPMENWELCSIKLFLARENSLICPAVNIIRLLNQIQVILLAICYIGEKGEWRKRWVEIFLATESTEPIEKKIS